MKDLLAAVFQSLLDVKSATPIVVTAAGAATVATTEPAEIIMTSLSLSEWSAIAVIFSCTATGLFMLSNCVFNLIKIRRELKNKHDDEQS
ncbi:MAG: hypothetical protein JKX91_06440 [Rhizobiaceae bacterium]|nr:hypothetical protein [Rhizobiaceae bacterium]